MDTKILCLIKFGWSTLLEILLHLIFLYIYNAPRKRFLWIKQIWALLCGQRKVPLISIYFLFVFFFEFKKLNTENSYTKKTVSLIKTNLCIAIREKIVSLNKRNISLIYGQWKNFFELKKVLLIKKNFFDPKK